LSDSTLVQTGNRADSKHNYSGARLHFFPIQVGNPPQPDLTCVAFVDKGSEPVRQSWKPRAARIHDSDEPELRGEWSNAWLARSKGSEHRSVLGFVDCTRERGTAGAVQLPPHCTQHHQVQQARQELHLGPIAHDSVEEPLERRDRQPGVVFPRRPPQGLPIQRSVTADARRASGGQLGPEAPERFGAW
jgi:hypothetical protein